MIQHVRGLQQQLKLLLCGDIPLTSLLAEGENSVFETLPANLNTPQPFLVVGPFTGLFSWSDLRLREIIVTAAISTIWGRQTPTHNEQGLIDILANVERLVDQYQGAFSDAMMTRLDAAEFLTELDAEGIGADGTIRFTTTITMNM